jgi:plasmid stability protein
MNITIKDIPSRLHRKLKDRAVAHKRSPNWEVIDILEAAVDSRPLHFNALFREVDEVHARLNVTPLGESILRCAKNEGRP